MGLQTMPCDALHKTRENRDKINAPLRLILLNNIVMPSSLVFPGSYMVLFYDGIKKNIQPINLRPVPLEQRQQVDQQFFFPLFSTCASGTVICHPRLHLSCKKPAWSCGDDPVPKIERFGGLKPWHLDLPPTPHL